MFILYGLTSLTNTFEEPGHVQLLLRDIYKVLNLYQISSLIGSLEVWAGGRGGQDGDRGPTEMTREVRFSSVASC